jgi:hypothetical protein
MGGDPETDQRQNKVAVLGAQEMTQSRIAPAMDPVDPVQALDDAQAAATRPP